MALRLTAIGAIALAACSLAQAGQAQEISSAPQTVSAQDATLERNSRTTQPMEVVRTFVADQQAIWTSPSRLHWGDASWLLPLAGVTEGFIATDRATARTLTSNPQTLTQARDFSQYGLGALTAGGALLYFQGRFLHEEHKRETGRLLGEAMINTFAVSSTLQGSLGRERPYQDGGRGNFLQGGTSFPSDHSALAWSAASVIAHEYPGLLTQVLAYGAATAVSAAGVRGQEHFPSDVVMGGAIGWLIGRQIYARHHDPELGGANAGALPGRDEEEQMRDPHRMGAPFVPLDSWVYPAMDRLAGLGYLSTSFSGLKPWTRLECARLIAEASENVSASERGDDGSAELVDRLHQEFSREIALLDGGRNVTASLESIYARAVSISGPPLTDGYHFGQTIAYDFGRPFEPGANAQAGAAVTASAGPLTIYLRGEYQHAPSTTALPEAAREAISSRDEILLADVPSGVSAPLDRGRLLDAYFGVNLDDWQLTIGKQSLDWAPGPGGSMLWSNNAEPINMVRMVNPEPIYLPSFLSHLGPVKIDQFWGRLGEQTTAPRPFIFGQKINLKITPWFEAGFGRTVTIGGKGQSPGNALTASNLLHSLVGVKKTGTGSVPGDSHAGMDWTFYVPKLRNYLVLYGDGYADDDPLPLGEPVRNPWRPGVYVPHIPKIPKLDFHIEGVSTEAPGKFGGGNQGQFTYWNQNYRDGYTNDRFLIGNTVGREGRAIQTWLTYWRSPHEILQFNYRHSSVNPDFIPGGGAWQDYRLHDETYLRSGLYLKADVQYENISRYPILWSGSQHNVSAIVELGFSPEYVR